MCTSTCCQEDISTVRFRERVRRDYPELDEIPYLMRPNIPWRQNRQQQFALSAYIRDRREHQPFTCAPLQKQSMPYQTQRITGQFGSRKTTTSIEVAQSDVFGAALIEAKNKARSSSSQPCRPRTSTTVRAASFPLNQRRIATSTVQKASNELITTSRTEAIRERVKAKSAA